MASSVASFIHLFVWKTIQCFVEWEMREKLNLSDDWKALHIWFFFFGSSYVNILNLMILHTLALRIIVRVHFIFFFVRSSLALHSTHIHEYALLHGMPRTLNSMMMTKHDFQFSYWFCRFVRSLFVRSLTYFFFFVHYGKKNHSYSQCFWHMSITARSDERKSGRKRVEDVWNTWDNSYWWSFEMKREFI